MNGNDSPKRFVIICKFADLKKELAFRWRDIGPAWTFDETDTEILESLKN